MGNKFNIVSLGCPKNTVDSDNLAQMLIADKFVYSESPETADFLLINTCGFIADAKKESIEEIMLLAGMKEKNTNLIVFGCLAKRYADDLRKTIPEIDALFGVAEEKKILAYCRKIRNSRVLKNQKIRISSETRPVKKSLFTPDSYAYLKIADGCNKKCTYCVIPSIRGNYKSAAASSILKQAEDLIRAGSKELILVAQDTACYAEDSKHGKPDSLSELLTALCSIDRDFWLRIMYLYPSSISDSLIHVIAREDKICKYLDIPFQHSEDRILKLMGRKGTRKNYLNLIKKIRETIPEAALRTSLIVGFPSETEAEFNRLADFVEEAQFDRLGVFKYSKEEGTPSAKLKGHLSDSAKNKRFETIMQKQSIISVEKNKKLIGKRFRALIDEAYDETAIARLYSHAPEIDGVVIIQNEEHEMQSPQSLKLKSGDFATVEITDSFDYDLKARLLL